MSANDFLAQSTPQSIGATSIPSSESFDNQTLSSTKRLSLLPIASRQAFPINSRIANVFVIYPDAILSSENIPTDLQLNVFNSRTYFEFTSSIVSQETFLTPVINSAANLSPNAIGSTESFTSSTLNFLTNIRIGSGINSTESLQNNNLLKYVERLLYPHIIVTNESFSSPSVFLSRTIYPGSSLSSEFLTNNHLINGIQATIRFVQQYSINSTENFSLNNIFSISPPPPLILASGFIKSWVSIVNSMIVNVTKKNILDVDTIIEYQRIVQPQKRYIIDSYIKLNVIEIEYHEKYSAISYLDVEEIDMARQTSNNLESYIKQKYHIESYIVSENIQMSKVTRYKIEKY